MAELIRGKPVWIIGGEHIRLLDIDAPETWQWHCEDELAVGTLAKERLTELPRGQQIEVTRSGKLRTGMGAR